MVRNFLKFMLLSVLWSFFLCVQAEDSIRWNYTQVEQSYLKLNDKDKESFHQTLMSTLSWQARNTHYQQKKIHVYTTYNSSPFLDFISNTAFASMEDKTIYCQFGGWMTAIENSKCVPPWKRSVRNDTDLDMFGEKYRHSCGGANLFRCNPTIFGPGDDGHGICTTTDDSDPNLSTTACMDSFNEDPDAAKKKVEDLKKNPQELAQYLAMTVETIRSCEVQSDPFSYCDKLTAFMEKSAKEAITCENQEALKSYLPDLITPLNQEELDRITDGLGAAALQYAAELDERQQKVIQHNKKVLEEGIKLAQADQRLKDTITRVRNNASKCLRGMCNGSKPPGKSIARCAAYVKQAIFPYASDKGKRFANFSEYPWGYDADDAVEGGNWLKKQGFVNMLDYPEMSDLTPENAPVGAIIVYEKVGASRKASFEGKSYGAPGHIEIKASEHEYISDFINDQPTRVGNKRRPIGIYYRIPKSFQDKLEEVPER